MHAHTPCRLLSTVIKKFTAQSAEYLCTPRSWLTHTYVRTYVHARDTLFGRLPLSRSTFSGVTRTFRVDASTGCRTNTLSTSLRIHSEATGRGMGVKRFLSIDSRTRWHEFYCSLSRQAKGEGKWRGHEIKPEEATYIHGVSEGGRLFKHQGTQVHHRRSGSSCCQVLLLSHQVVERRKATACSSSGSRVYRLLGKQCSDWAAQTSRSAVPRQRHRRRLA